MLISHYFKMAIRNFRRHRSSFLINLIGLSTGLACAMLITLWVVDELQVNKFHEKDDRLFKIMEHQEYSDRIGTTSSTPGLLAKTLKEEFPEFEYAITVNWRNRYTLSHENDNFHFNGYYASSDFFNVFSFPLIVGDANQVLQDLNSCTLSKTAAEKLFGSVDDAVGKVIQFNHKAELAITGVFEDPPSTSTFKFDVVMNYEKYFKENEWLASWGNNSPPSYCILKDGVEAESLSNKIAEFIKTKDDESNVTLFLKKFSDHYLHGRYENGKLDGGRIEYVRMFSLIALFILLIACINFMNLSTARASRRAKEVGVKKAIGAERKNLVGQYLSESVLLALVSLVLALIIVVISIPVFNELTDKTLSLNPNPTMVFGFLGITLITGLLAGSYPALYLSSFNPTTVLKGSIKSSLGELWARRGLVVFQFTLSIIFIVSVIVIYQQIKYVQEKSLGYERDNLLYFYGDGTIGDNRQTFLQEVRRIPGVKGVSAGSHNMLGQQNNTSGLEWPGKDPTLRVLFENISADYGFIETIGVELKEGRFFSEDFGSDTTKIIFNEAAIEVMGLEEPIGKVIRLWEEHDLEIIGVVKDFHFQSMHTNVRPLFFRYNPENTYVIMTRLEAGREQEAISNIQQFYEKFNPGFPFKYDFLDQEYAELYAAEQRVGGLSRYFAGFAILISCLGLFGLAAFTADRKKKEIGIRKVLGASMMDIISLLTKDFTRLVFVSILVGLPVAWYFMNNWLSRFAYRIELNPAFFLLAGVLVLLIAWLTVGSQALSSARVNPRDCLTEE